MASNLEEFAVWWRRDMRKWRGAFTDEWCLFRGWTVFFVSVNEEILREIWTIKRIIDGEIQDVVDISGIHNEKSGLENLSLARRTKEEEENNE